MVYYTKLRDVKDPIRGTVKSSGIDFFIPNYSIDFVDKLTNASRKDNDKIQELIKLNNRFILKTDEKGFIVSSLGRVFIPSGIKVALPENCDFVAHNKSGIATKSGLLFGAHLVDEDYEGEIFFSLFNVSPDPVQINFGQKIIQLVLRNVLYDDLQNVSHDDLAFIHQRHNSSRGDGAVGSTGL